MAAQNQEPALRVHTIFAWCNDVDAMQRFYAGLLGLHETYYRNDEEHGWLTFQMRDVQLVFMRASETLPVLSDWARQPGYRGGTLDAESWLFMLPADQFTALVRKIKQSDEFPVLDDDSFDPTRQIFVRDPMGRTIEIGIELE